MLHEFIVPPEAEGQRLDVWLASQIPDLTRSQAQKALAEGRVGVAHQGRVVVNPKSGYPLQAGDAVWIEFAVATPLCAVPQDIPLDVLHEDEQVIAVNKAPGMVVHPAIGHPKDTLINAVLGRWPMLHDDTVRPGVVHRLDADTSGVILVARTIQSLAFLQQQFRDRLVEKRYLALLAGEPALDWWSCVEPIGRHPHDIRKRVIGGRDPKEAETSFRVLSRHNGWCVVEARPRTGRTHQIRVHAAHAGHPILADAVYGRAPHWPLVQPRLFRQALHAWTISFRHPNQQRINLTAPIPQDLREIIGSDLAPVPAVR